MHSGSKYKYNIDKQLLWLCRWFVIIMPSGDKTQYNVNSER